MRIIIGIIVGILIVFNWSSIKELFDSSLASQSGSSESANAPATPAQPPAPPPPQSLSGSVEQRLKDAATDRK